MKLSDFDYYLPKELIAQRLTRPRDHARLMILKGNDALKDSIIDTYFYKLVEELNPGDVLVLNSTKVSESKIVGRKETGSPAEVILTKKIDSLKWCARIKTRSPKPGQKILVESSESKKPVREKDSLLKRSFLERDYIKIVGKESDDLFIVELSSPSILMKAKIPAPPYIKRDVSNSEYQTVYSKEKGSLAAPTAGLHFTTRLLNKIEKKGVKIVFITLHIGFGTFLPVSEDIVNHKMESEYYYISEECANIINNRKGKLVVVGTTTLKALESSSKNGKIFPGEGYSDKFIYPGYKFNSGTDVLITNFHLPKSSLILLVCAFAGKERILDAYNYAVKKKYRFYSLGDAMMIYRKNNQKY